MNIQYFFPTAICSITDVELANTMLPIAKKYLNSNVHLTYQWGYKNTYTSGQGIEKNQEFFQFTDIIKKHSSEYMASLGYDLSVDEFEVYLFASEMTAGDKHALHTHQNSILSGVFYLEVPEGSSNIVFHDPRPFRKFVNYPTLKNTEVTWDQIFFKPEKGLLLLWESWIEHEVPVNSNQEGRITLVFNIIKK